MRIAQRTRVATLFSIAVVLCLAGGTGALGCRGDGAISKRPANSKEGE